MNTLPKSQDDPGQPELKYDYAKNTEIPRIDLNTLSKTENGETIKLNQLPKSGGDSGQPELKYDYAANTEIPRINLNNLTTKNEREPELKYDYATNTDIPRINLNNLQPKCGDGVDPSTNQTPEEPNQAPHYSTLEAPEVKAKNEESGDRIKPESDGINPSTNPTYHTLEEPHPPPHYSTLEEPEDETKPLVSEINQLKNTSKSH